MDPGSPLFATKYFLFIFRAESLFETEGTFCGHRHSPKGL